MSVATEPRVVGRYELHGELASGGMATVYLGRSIGSAGFSKSVAIKRLHDQFARDPEFVSLLLEEARLSERIRHANVVTVLDVVAADHELLLVMEYVHGETLARLLRACAEAGETCPREVAASIAHGVLLGLHAAHTTTDASGKPLCIIHRDVSPQNIIVGADGVARLLDFGIAKAAGSASGTREGQVKGKVPYMAPEILHLHPASVQSDLYAVAVTLWESLCARRLFRADTEIGLWGQVLAGNIPRPSSLIGHIGPLEDVIMRALSRAPADRYPTALAMAQALEQSMRLASPTEVAAWVRGRAAASLAERAAAVQSIDGMQPRASAELTPPVVVRRDSARAGASTTANAVAADAPPPRASRPWAMRALVACLAIAIVALVALRGLDARRARSAPPPAAAAPVTMRADPLPVSPEPVVAAPPVTATPSVAPADPPVAKGPRRRPPASPPPVAAPKPPQDPCDPPFSLDASGRKHFKLNCVGN
ncbi:MAG TPA: serine/threonine-protein kinase [Labilithrix sp.]|nr:serine/threonine-protein kinase [Labilithrix sp.]